MKIILKFNTLEKQHFESLEIRNLERNSNGFKNVMVKVKPYNY